MKIIISFLVFMCMVSLAASGFAQSQPKQKNAKSTYYETSTMTSTVIPKGNAATVDDQSDDPVQGKIVYVNNITREIFVADENNVRRPVKLSTFLFNRVKIGQTVNVSGDYVGILSRGRSPTGSLFVSRRYVGSRLIERWD
jgi:hypothetical protein